MSSGDESCWQQQAAKHMIYGALLRLQGAIHSTAGTVAGCGRSVGGDCGAHAVGRGPLGPARSSKLLEAEVLPGPLPFGHTQPKYAAWQIVFWFLRRTLQSHTTEVRQQLILVSLLFSIDCTIYLARF